MKHKILFLISILLMQGMANAQLDKSKSVGSTAGSFEVNLSGAATYQIPIYAPPGTAGMQPNISLVYSSQGGIGIMGRGWNISGLSSIFRTSKTIYADGKVEGLQLNNTDRFSLDGNLLVRTAGTNEFKTETETFSKIVAYPSADEPTSFTVYNKNGSTITYNVGNIINNKTITWNIASISDEWGNKMLFNYQKINNNLYISNIQYTLNSAAGLNTAYNELQFIYIQNQPAFKKYFLGQEQYSNVLLSEVKSIAEGSLVRKYTLAYESKNNISYLQKVTESNSTGEQYNATIFNWTNGLSIPNGYHYFSSDINANLLNARTAFLSDANGDGVDEMIALKGDSVFIFNAQVDLSEPPIKSCTQISTSSILVGDVNGDGKADLVEYSTGDIYVSFANPGNPGTYFTKTKWGHVDGASGYPPSSFWLQDVNGDGKADLLLKTIDDYTSFVNGKLTTSTTVYLKIYTSNTSEFSFLGSIILEKRADNSVISNIKEKLAFGDINGDGILDIMYLRTYDSVTKINYPLLPTTQTKKFINVYLNKFNTLGTIQSSTLTGDLDNFLTLADVNGDGLADKIDCDGNAVYVSLSKGDGTFASSINWASGIPSNLLAMAIPPGSPIFVNDINGDGLPEIIRVINNKIHYIQNTGSAFIYKGSIDFPYNSANELMFLGDINGDGILDFIKIKPSIGEFTYCFSSEGLLEDGNRKIFGITNGMGNLTYIEYKVQQQKEPSSSTSYNYPFIVLNNRLPVVSNVKEYSKDDNSLSWENVLSYQTYTFEKPVVHMHGKGFLGFQNVTINTLKDSMLYRQEIENSRFSYSMYPTWNKLYMNNNLENETKCAYNIQTLANQRFFTTKTQEEVYNPSDEIKTRTNYTYDTAGNISTTTTYISNSIGGSILKTDSVNISYTRYGMVDKPKVIITIQKIPQGSTDIKRLEYSYYSDGKLNTEYRFNGIISVVYKNATQYTDYNVFGLPTKTILKSQIVGNPQYVNSCLYDAKGRFIIQKTNSIGHTAYYEYESQYGNMTKSTDANGLITQYSYDNWGKLKKTIYPDNTIAEQSINWYTGTDIPNALYYASSTATAQAPVEIFYDAIGREVCSHTQSDFSPNKNIYVDTRYNKKGKVEKKSYPYSLLRVSDTEKQWTIYKYDEKRRLKEEQSTTLHRTYSYPLHKQIVTDILNGNTTYTKEYNGLGQLVKAVDPGGDISYKYNIQGLPIETSCNGAKTTISYDDWGNRISITEPNAGTITSVYNEFDQLTKQTDANGNFTTYTYDALGRVQNKFINGNASAEGSVSYTYDIGNKAKGKVYTSVSSYHTSTFTYDNLGRTLSQKENINGTSYTTQYTYNTVGQLSKLTYPGGFFVDYEYNTLGELSTVSNTTAGVYWKLYKTNILGQSTKYTWGNDLCTTSEYDLTGNLLKRKTGHKTGSSSTNPSPGPGFGFTTQTQTTTTQQSSTTPVVTEWDYNSDGYIQNWEYTYNNRGMLTQTQCKRTNQYNNYTYDNLNRLTAITGPSNYSYSIVYDASGNITQQGNMGGCFYAPTLKPHALRWVYPTNYELPFDDTYPTDECITSYTPFNKIKRILEGSNMLDFTYGNDQQRVLSAENSMSGDMMITKTTTFVSGLYEEENNSFTGATRKLHYVHAGGKLLGIYVQQSSSAKMYYVHTDRLGSYDMITDADGNIVDSLSFDAWGNRRAYNNWSQPEAVGTTHIFTRGFTGHEHLDKFNIINMNGRLYDPVIARFFSPDPFLQAPDFSQNFNRYSYCMNNPLMLTDPSGYWAGWDDVIVGAIGFAAGYISHGISTGNWGWDAVGSGAISAGMFLLGYYTAGASIASSGTIASGYSSMGLQGWANQIALRYAGSMAASQIISSLLPSATFQVGENLSMSLSPSFLLGSGGFTVGLNLGIAYHYGDVTLGFSMGASYGKDMYTSKLGSEARRSYFGGYDNGTWGMGLSSTIFTSGETSQRLGRLSLRYGDFHSSYENDGTPFHLVGLGGGTDSYRTASVTLGYKDFTIGMLLFTGFRQFDPEIVKEAEGYPHGMVGNPEINDYNAGILYLGYGNMRVGWNHDNIRHAFQNHFAHGFLTKQAWIPRKDWPNGPYVVYGKSNPYTNY